MIVLVCNAGAGSGFGHLMRCRALAGAMRDAGGRCVLLGPSASYRNPFDGVLFDEWIAIEEWSSPQKEAERLLSVAARVGAHAAVLDDYRANNDYQRVLHDARFRWLQFDTSIDGPRYPDVLVNPSPGARAEDYFGVMKKRDVLLLLGPQFAILRAEFPPEARDVKAGADLTVMLTFGAGDDRGAGIFVLEELVGKTDEGLSYLVVSGEHNPQNSRLMKWVEEKGDDRVSLLINPRHMSTAYAECDIAIMSGGTSIYEAAACGLPMLLLTVADNQVKQAKAWAEAGAAVYLGGYGEVQGESLRKVVNLLVRDRGGRGAMSTLGRSMVDGLGAARVAQHVLALSGRKV